MNRFSEDIDLSVSPEFLELPEAGPSHSQADKWMKKAEAACAVAVEHTISPDLEVMVESLIGEREAGPWFEFLIDAASSSPTLLFHYPSFQTRGFDYLKRFVKLEFGSLTDQQPVGRHAVRPWVAESFPLAFPDWECEVVALEIERTFWEKATILHTEFHRPSAKPMPDRFSRHYADTVALAEHESVLNTLKDQELRARVVHWKSRFFSRSWANYGQALPGGLFRLVPPSSRLTGLKRDYVAMQEMYLKLPPSFEQILESLALLESRLNQPM